MAPVLRSPSSVAPLRRVDRWTQIFMDECPAKRPVPLEPQLPGQPLTPTLSPSDGAREPKARMMRFRGPMRERPPRGILTRPAATLSEGEEPHAKGAKGAKSWEPRNTLNTRKGNTYAAL
jgi:hypothetical protein